MPATHTDAKGGKFIALWLTLVAVIASPLLAMVMDRVAVADATSRLEVRVQNLEQAQVEAKNSDQKILDALAALSKDVENNRVMLQEVMDRQDEVRRKLGISR